MKRSVMSLIDRIVMRWYWNQEFQCWDLKRTRYGRSKASVWPNGVWHTWDKNGVGGENSTCQYAEHMDFENRHFAAKREAWKSCREQGFIGA